MIRSYLITSCLAIASMLAAQAGVMHVAPNGSDTAAGSKEAPLATIEEAVRRLPDGGKVQLLAGIYRDEVMLPEAGEEAPALTIEAAEGEVATFDGGAPLGPWVQVEEGTDVYATRLPASVGQNAQAYLNVWDAGRRVRFIRMMDEAGMRGWPKSFSLSKDGQLLIHFPGGKPPEGSLECNKNHRGIVVLRPNVTIRNIGFRNFFLNHYSAAISVGRVRNVEIADCTMTNVIRAVYVTPQAADVRVKRCTIRDAGTAIASSGDMTVVEECTIQAPEGDYAIHELSPVLKCGIRIYHPARGATVRSNVTKGFRYGLRIKSGESGKNSRSNATPFVIEKNSFLDGVSITFPTWQNFGIHSKVAQNAICLTDGEGNLQEHEKEWRTENYFYHAAGSEPVGGNVNRDPFLNAAAGDLQRKSGAMPEEWGAPQTAVSWVKEGGKASLANTQKEAPQYAPFIRSGGAALLYVKAGAQSAHADGSKERPYPALQPALDQVEPGDTVVIGSGLYTEEAALTRSGAVDAPITLRGDEDAIFDGGRKLDVLLNLTSVRHVHVEGMTFRWFREAGLSIKRSSHVTIERCRFFNSELDGRENAVGNGIAAEQSPQLQILHSVFSRNKVGMKLVDCPQASIRHNTGFKNLNTAVEMVRSCSRSELMYNSFGYSSHASIYLWEPDAAALASLVCDYNNYAIRLYDYRKYDEKRATPAPVNALAVPARYGAVAGGKAVVDVLDSRIDNRPRIRYHSLEAWQEAHGKDRHSIFADPQYLAPVEGDFCLLPESPNRLDSGLWIGACEPETVGGQVSTK